MNDNRLEERIRRSFSEPAPLVDGERLLQDARRGAARRSTRRRVALVAAAAVVAAGTALAVRTLPENQTVPPAGQDRHGSISGFWRIDSDHAVRVTQERCGGDRCSRIWTGDGQRSWSPATTVRWAGGAGEGMATGPVSRVQMTPDGHDGWAWGDQTWATVDGGASWQPMPDPGTGSGDVLPRSTTVTSDGRAWSVGPSLADGLFTAAPGADTWSGVSLPSSVERIDKVVGTARHTAVLVLDRSGRPGLLVGSNGLEDSHPADLPCAAVDAEQLTADRDAFFAACALTSRDRAVIWSSVDGDNWRRLATLPRRGLLDELTGIDARSVLATVGTTRAPFPTFRVTEDSVTRVRLGPGRGTPTSSQFVAGTGTLVIDVDGKHTALVQTEDGGRTWQVVE